MKKLFQTIGHFFQLLFGDAEKIILSNADIAIHISSVVEFILKNPATEFALSLVPGPVGIMIRSIEPKILSVIDTVVQAITEEQACSKLTTAKDRIDCFIKYLGSLPAVQKNAILAKFSSLILQALEGSGTSESDADTAAQMRFKQLKMEGTLPVVSTK